jgi:hypothetical protein
LEQCDKFVSSFGFFSSHHTAAVLSTTQLACCFKQNLRTAMQSLSGRNVQCDPQAKGKEGTGKEGEKWGQKELY